MRSNPAYVKLCTRVEDLKKNVRAMFGKPPLLRGIGFSVGTESCVKTIFKTMGDKGLELAYWLTAAVNDVTPEQLSQPDALVLEEARRFMEANETLFAEVVLSGGDE